MRNKLLFCLVFAVALVLLAAVGVAALDRRDRDVVGYNLLAERIFKGIVAGKGNIIDDFVYFPLRIANTILEVQIGPKHFVEGGGFKINTGDAVTVVGMPVLMKERHIVLAREVRSPNGTLVVRDEVGLPIWDRPVPMDPQRPNALLQKCAANAKQIYDPLAWWANGSRR